MCHRGSRTLIICMLTVLKRAPTPGLNSYLMLSLVRSLNQLGNGLVYPLLLGGCILSILSGTVEVEMEIEVFIGACVED